MSKTSKKTLLKKAEVWQGQSLLTQRVSRARLIRAFRLHIRRCVEQGDQQAKTGNLDKAKKLWSQGGKHMGVLLDVFG